MTITALPMAAPVEPAAARTAGGSGSDPSAVGDFKGLVDSHLQEHEAADAATLAGAAGVILASPVPVPVGQIATPLSVAAVTGSAATVPTTAGAATAPTTALTTGAGSAATTTQLRLPGTGSAPAPATTPGSATPGPVDVTVDVTGAGSGAGPGAGSGHPVAAPAAVLATGAPQPTDAPLPAPVVQPQAETPTETSSEMMPGTRAAAGSAVADAAAEPSKPAAAPVPEPATSLTGVQPPSGAQAAPVQALGPVVGSPAGGQAQPSSLVSGQVFPAVAKLVDRGDGMHRLSLRLHPEELGEVRITVTIKDNTVDVTLSAGPVAREALRNGSPELRALLDLAGATTGNLVVKDLPGGSAQTATGVSAGSAGTTGDPMFAGGSRDGDHEGDSAHHLTRGPGEHAEEPPADPSAGQPVAKSSDPTTLDVRI